MPAAHAAPIVYALILKTGVMPWLGVDDSIGQAVAAGAATVVFYVVVRVLERAKSSKWGWLLGYPSPPVYPATPE